MKASSYSLTIELRLFKVEKGVLGIVRNECWHLGSRYGVTEKIIYHTFCLYFYKIWVEEYECN